MLLNRQHSKVLDPVIARIAIDVIHLLTGEQSASQVAFHDEAMFEHALAIDGDPLVRVVPIGSVSEAVASFRTEPFCGYSTRRQVKKHAALIACSSDASVVVGSTATKRSQTRHIDCRQLCLTEASSGAELSGFDSVQGYIEGCFADGATQDGPVLLTWLGTMAHRNIMPRRQAIAIALNTQRRAGKGKR
jgi:hypothetical protein